MDEAQAKRKLQLLSDENAALHNKVHSPTRTRGYHLQLFSLIVCQLIIPCPILSCTPPPISLAFIEFVWHSLTQHPSSVVVVICRSNCKMCGCDRMRRSSAFRMRRCIDCAAANPCPRMRLPTSMVGWLGVLGGVACGSQHLRR